MKKKLKIKERTKIFSAPYMKKKFNNQKKHVFSSKITNKFFCKTFLAASSSQVKWLIQSSKQPFSRA
jgi:hypothetical protein